MSFLSPSLPLIRTDTLLQAISDRGILSGLKVCLDATDKLSITSASPTKWLDRSGNGYDFNFGSGSGADAADPTFVGRPGGNSSGEYLSFDGGDYLTYDSANETAFEALHKDSAIWGACGWLYAGSTGWRSLFGTSDSSFSIRGVQVAFSSLTTFTVRVGNSTAPVGTSFDRVSVVASILNNWAFWGFGIDEPANSYRENINGVAASIACTYNAPSAVAAKHVLQIGAAGNAENPMKAGDRMACTALWQGYAPTAADLAAIFSATRGRFGV